MRSTTARATSAWPGAAYAIGSAALFGASTPLAKGLLGDGAQPLMLAGLFYLGSGIGLSLLQLVRFGTRRRSREAPLRRADMPRLAAAVLLGGALAPAMLLLGLNNTSASAAALLLNLEGVATMGIAWLVFRENVDRRLLLGALAIVAGAMTLSWSGGIAVGPAALLIVAACVAWGLDNNLTRGLSAADPVQITLIKGLVAGGVNCALALGTGGALPGWLPTLGALAVGFFGYGVSLVLFVRALRHLGAARTSAYFSTAPFLGALIAVALFSEPVSLALALAAALMGLGVYLHLQESHLHAHTHTELEHEHQHEHDSHHHHRHGALDPAGEPHSHWHRHAPLVHAHPHYPDLHHRHDH
jgi:drug/metabolite transporter (DMT)-like permease